MAMDSAGCLKMARLVAIAQIVIAGLLFVFGIAELLVDERSFTAYAGFGIWNGIWLAITGGLGIPGTSRERTSRSNAFAGVYMGFSITSAVFAGVSIICYSLALTFSYGNVRRYQLQAPFALAVVMLIFSIVNFVLGIWAAVCCCSLATCECCATSALQDTQMVYMANPGMPAGGYVIAQGPGAVPVAVPVQEGGGAGMVAVQVPTSTVMGQQTQTLSHNPQVAYVPVSGQMVPAGAMGGQAQYVQYGTGPSYTATGVNQSQKQIPAKQ